MSDDFDIKLTGVGEILEAHLSSACLHGCKVDVDQLIHRFGMTQDTMALFRFSFDEWMGLLGLRMEHIKGMSEAQTDRAFGLTRNVVEAAVQRRVRR